MTNDEFSKWLAYFDACFPSYAEKRNRLTDKSTTLVAWYKLFAGVSLRHAMVATDAALKEEIPGITNMTPWDKYPQFIRAKARQVASQAAGSAAGPSFRKRGPDGEITYACLKCSDTGWREVVSAKSLQDARNFEPWMESGVVWPALAACDCEAGAKFASWKFKVANYKDLRHAIDYPCIIDRPKTLIEWRNWLLNSIRKSHEWNPDSQPTNYSF